MRYKVNHILLCVASCFHAFPCRSLEHGLLNQHFLRCRQGLSKLCWAFSVNLPFLPIKLKYCELSVSISLTWLQKLRSRYAPSDWPRGVFAWEYVNMVVTSRCFAFRALIRQAQIWKSFRVQNSTILLHLPIPSSAETWNISTNKLCQFCFRLSWHFKREKSVFWRASFCKRRTDYACKPSCSRLCDW